MPFRMDTIRNTGNNKYWQGHRQLEPLCTASGTVEWYSHYGKQHSGSWNRIITSPQRTESRASKLLHTMAAAAAWWRSNPSVLRWMAGQTWRGLHIQWNIIRPEKGRKLTPATTRVNLEDIRLREVSQSQKENADSTHMRHPDQSNSQRQRTRCGEGIRGLI